MSTSHRYDDGVTPRSENRSEVALLTTMSTAYHESAVRIILADMQLAGIVDAYRARIPDAAVREAVRRWDAGVRVANIDGFERKTIAGQWRIVHTGTERPIQGAAVDLKD
jgi:hypothetical protein